MPYCKTCDRKFRDAASLQQHLRTSGAEHPRCQICERKFTDETAFEQHMESKHPKRYPCPTHPNSIFNTPEALEDHYRGHSSHPNCLNCGKGYLNWDLMMEHHDAAHPNVVCEMCGGHRTIYLDQQQTHWQQSRWHPSCEKCEEGFYNRAALAVHMEECGKETCEACGAIFMSEYPIEGEKLCEVCCPREEYEEVPDDAPMLVLQPDSGEWRPVGTPQTAWPATPFSPRPDGRAAPLPQPTQGMCSIWSTSENRSTAYLAPSLPTPVQPSLQPSQQLITQEHSLASRHNLPTLETQGLKDATRSTLVVDHSARSGKLPDDPSPNVESPSGLSELPNVSPYPATPSESNYNPLESREPRIRSISGLYARPSTESLTRPAKVGRMAGNYTAWPMDRRTSSMGRGKELTIMTPIESHSPLDSWPELPGGNRVSMYDNIMSVPLPASDEEEASPMSSPTTNVSTRSEDTSSSVTKAEPEVYATKIAGGSKMDDVAGMAGRTLRRTSHLPRLVEHTKSVERAAIASAPAPAWSDVLKCRLCARNPCEEPTVTMCGHLFCNKCIVDAIISGSSCPLCSVPQLLYCIFKLRLD